MPEQSGDDRRQKWPKALFSRFDESDDRDFYQMPRLVLHVDPETAAALTAVYRDCLQPDSRVLDLMSSWVSHLPEDLSLSEVAGLGMNAVELAANPRLDRYEVQDLNTTPTLPFADATFDAVLNAFSVQYLTRPDEVFAEAARVLAPGGLHLIAISHRCFPTKAVAAHRDFPLADRLRLLSACLAQAGALWGDIRTLDRSPAGADPLHVMVAQRAAC